MIEKMPDYIKQNMIRVQGGKQYLPTAYRIVWARTEHPTWSITTEIIEGGHQAGYASVKATVRDENGFVLATAHKTEEKKDFPAGWVEKAETGAIGRALALCGYGTQFDDTLYDNADAPADAPVAAAKPAGKTWFLEEMRKLGIEVTARNAKELLGATMPELSSKGFANFEEQDWQAWAKKVRDYVAVPDHPLLPGEDPYAEQEV